MFLFHYGISVFLLLFFCPLIISKVFISCQLTSQKPSQVMPTEPVGPVEVVVVAAEMGAVHQVEEEKEEEEKMRVPGIVVSRR